MIEVAANLRREEHLVAAALEGQAEDLLAVAPTVHVGRVEEIHTEVDGLPHRVDRVCVLRGTVRIPVGIPADRPSPEADFGHLETRSSEGAASHRCPNGEACKNVSGVSPR